MEMKQPKLTVYDINKQLMEKERRLDAIELNKKAIEISNEMKSLNEGKPQYLMLLNKERSDYTVFEFTHTKENEFKEFKKDLIEVLQNRGSVLRIDKVINDVLAWEIWIKEKGENYLYYLFDYSEAILRY